MNSFIQFLEGIEKLIPDVWLNNPDPFESKGVNWHVEIIPINNITEVAWTVTKTRKKMEKMFQNGEKLPMVLIELRNGIYELHDGQHRFAAYRNVFPNAKYIKAAVFKRN